MLYAAERMLELATDPEITSPHVRNIPQTRRRPGRGKRGSAARHFDPRLHADEDGILRKVNLIVGTTNNHAAICDVHPQSRREADPGRPRSWRRAC